MSIDKLATDEQECLVMFNRALEYNDSVAWQFLHQRFRGMMRHWLQQYLVGNGRYWIESYENCIDLAFERVWFAASYKQRIHFESVAAALQYLRMSLISVALDTLRAKAERSTLYAAVGAGGHASPGERRGSGRAMARDQESVAGRA